MAESKNVTVFSQNFSTAQKAQARANIGAASANEGNSAILEWDGTSRLYDQIKELVDAGQIVFIKKSQYYYTPLEGLLSGRFCYVSMPTSYVVFYLEFYPSGHPTGFSETTQVNATAKYYTHSMTDEAIYTGTTSNLSSGLQVFTDSYGLQYIYGGESGDKYYYYSMNPQGPILYYEFSRTGSSPNYTYSRRAVNAQVYPVITNVKSSSTYNNPKVVRVCLCYLDKFADDTNHTAQQAEFEIQCTTGATTPNGIANSSFSMHVLLTARDNGGPIKVDCRITGNNGWDFVNAEPTITAYDTNNGNGVIFWFGLQANGVWQDFEETYVTLVNLKPDVETMGTVDSVKSYADPTWHPNTLSLPTCTAVDALKSLVVNGTGDGLEWSHRISGGLYNGDSSDEMRRIRINTYNNTNSPGTVIAFPVSGQGAFCGTLMPDPNDGNIDQVARIIDNPNNPGIGMLTYQDDAAVISPLEKYTITTSTNPYEVNVQPGKWYEIVCSQSTAQSWNIYLEADSLVTTNTVHTIVRITRTNSSVSCSPTLVWHDERGIAHYEPCDLTGSTSYYDFDCLVRKNGYTVSGAPWSFARVRRL